MKRDMELIRKLLIFFDEKPEPHHVQVPPIEAYDELAIKYHLVLLHDAGYLRCEVVKSSTSDRTIYVVPFDLTWEGHEFLDRIRDQHIWNEVRKQIRDRGFTAASVEFLKTLADAAIRKRLGLEQPKR